MIRVLHLLDHSLPLHSGYSFRSQSILRAQQARGWHVAVVTSSRHEASWKKEAPPVEEIGRIRYYRSGPTTMSHIPFLGERALIDTLAKRALEASEVEHPTILHAHSPVLTAMAAFQAARRLRLPVVYEVRAFWEDAAVDHGTYAEGSWRYRLTRAAETWVCRRANQVTVLCHGIEDDLAARGIPRDKMAIVGNAIDPESFGSPVPDERDREAWGLSGRRVAAFIGSFYRYEGLDLLVQAFAQVAEALPDLVLLLVGGGEMDSSLKGLAARLGVADRVLFPGRIPHERVPGVYALADVLVYPRYSLRITELVTPLKPLEAMAMGKALIASDVGGHRELIRDGETGILFRAGDAGSLAQALERVLADAPLRGRLEEAGRRWVRAERTWERTTSVYPDVYARALGAGGG